MNKLLTTSTLAALLCGGLAAATTNTTLTVDATGALSGTSVNAAGTASLTNIGSGNFTATLSFSSVSGQNISAPFTITLSGGNITGTLLVPLSILSGTSSSVTGSATVTGGTGSYAGATGSFPSLTGTGGISTTTGAITMHFSGAGTITTGGTGGGPTPPAITTIQNNYGLIAPGLPNYGIAPSTLFFIQGSNLANTTTDLISSASPGLPTTLSNVTVNVTAGGTTTACPLYYLSPTQIDAVLPGNTPVGNATITVTNNGATSAAFQIPVVQSAFGILSYNGSLAAAYDANYTIYTSGHAANPGDAVVLWGSGVGADPKDDDKLFPQAQDNLTNIPMHAYVGGVEAAIAYRGRSQFPGVDQVVLTIPSNAPTGCYVSLAIVSGNIVSNSVTIPIAASGRTCSDAGGTALPPDVVTGLAGKTTIRSGFLLVGQTTEITASGSQAANTIGAFFQSVSGLSNSNASNQVSIGSCIVYSSTTNSPTGGASSTGLDAGSAINVTGPAGSLSLGPLSFPGLGAGFYAPPNGTVPASFIPTGGGTFTFDNGSGGKDVGHFNTSLALPPAFTWTNASSVSSISRSQGVNVTWSGGGQGTFVQIEGGATATGTGKTVTFVCNAPLAAGQFNVPIPVLLSLPAGSGNLSVSDMTGFQTFTASGLDLGLAIGESSTSKTVTYQ